MFFQVIMNGLAAGSIYTLTALGMAIIYKTSHVLNFAHGEKAMFTTFIAFSLLRVSSIPIWGALLLTLIAAIFIGWFVEFLFIRRIRQRGATHGTYILITLGFFMAIHGLAGWIWGTGVERFPKLISSRPLSFLGTIIGIDSIVSLGVACILMLFLYVFFQYTLGGLSMRAMSENLKASLLMGIRANRIFLITWGIACVLGAIAGLLIVPVTYLHPGMMLPILLKALSGAILGGFDSYPGVVIGCLLVGIFESLIGAYISLEMKQVFAFLLITVVLLIRPTGIMGAKEIKKV
jgi:branched-chain amino acid transport system permease protein